MGNRRHFLELIVEHFGIESSTATAFLPISMSQNSPSGAVDESNLMAFLYALELKTVIWCMLKYLEYSDNGYDARARNLFRELFVRVYKEEKGTKSSVLVEFKDGNNTTSFDEDYLAAQIFIYTERLIGTNLMLLVEWQTLNPSNTNNANEENQGKQHNVKKIAKIAGMSILAGTAFAITGGLAAPGIAAGR